MKERIVIVFIAVALGLLITTIGFFVYQQAKSIPQNLVRTLSKTPTQNNPKDTIYLTVDEPQNESLSSKRSIQVKGSTNPDNVIVVSTNIEDVVATPSSGGNFAVTITIDTGANKLFTRAIAPDGKTKEDLRTITFSTEEF